MRFAILFVPIFLPTNECNRIVFSIRSRRNFMPSSRLGTRLLRNRPKMHFHNKARDLILSANPARCQLCRAFNVAGKFTPAASKKPNVGRHCSHSPGQNLGQHCANSPFDLNKWRFPKIKGTILGVPIIRNIVFWGLYWGPLILGNYQMVLRRAALSPCWPAKICSVQVFLGFAHTGYCEWISISQLSGHVACRSTSQLESSSALTIQCASVFLHLSN